MAYVSRVNLKESFPRVRWFMTVNMKSTVPYTKTYAKAAIHVKSKMQVVVIINLAAKILIE